MPVGKVYDAAANQVLFSPVSNFYQGKAIRQQLAAGEQDQELKGLQIEAAKDELANAPNDRAKAEKMWQMQYEAASANLEGALLENGEKTMQFMATSLSSLTSQATERAMAGDVQGALDEFNSGIQSAKSSFPAPIAEKVKSGAGEDGVYDAEELKNLKMSLAPWWARDPQDRSPRDVLVDGEPAVAFWDKAGNMFYEDGRPVLGQVTPFAVNEGGVVGGSDVSKSGANRNVLDFQENVIGAVGAIQSGTEMLLASESNPEALGVPGGAMRFGTNLVSGAKAIADWAGWEPLDPDETEVQDMGFGGFDYTKIDTDKLGVSGAEAEKFRAGVYGIAFAAAVAEQGTRPTDKDIQQFIDQIGGRATSPQSFRETITQFMRRQNRRLNTIADVKGISGVDRDAAFAAWNPAYRKFMETYAKTSGRATATNEETGQRFIEMSSGNWEEF